MSSPLNRPQRGSIRLKGYDYRQAGAYFVTLCAYQRECLFGEIEGDQIRYSSHGLVVAECWQWLETHYSFVSLDEWVIMPNHLHGIIVMDPDQGGSRAAPTKPLGNLVGAFKTVSTRRINALRDTPGFPVWQRNYFEHIIRDEVGLDRIRRYIVENPNRWSSDSENPTCRGGL